MYAFALSLPFVSSFKQTDKQASVTINQMGRKTEISSGL